ncbi:peroxisomal membrane protein PEX14-like [Gigantopelta aegis]|uniref:peroxisomal membrane protein PEX14-like n=1 Tax=Gigantopelta aegis TaxID=1735272 RepID=UPI001B88D6B2|nr:peroxisomal membrane protein PEX14-like [Gigantopelta aegis]
MADEIEKTHEVTKEVLAPSDGPRENLILTAVKFLQNPKVIQSPLYQKRAFLERKGLTKEEVDIAMQRAGVVEDASTTQQVNPAPYAQHQNHLALVQQLHHPVPVTLWSRTRDFTTTAVIIASVSYAVYRMYQLYIKPWLIGKSEDEESRTRRLEEYITEQMKTTAQVQQILKTIQESMTAQQTSIANLQQHVINRKNLEKFEQSTESHLIAEIKSEVTSLKGLLLSRRQFPPTPQTGPVIPTWQLDSSPSASVSGSSSLTYEMVKANSFVDVSEMTALVSSPGADPSQVNLNLSDSSQDVVPAHDNSSETIGETVEAMTKVEQVAATENTSELSNTSMEKEDSRLKPVAGKTDSDIDTFKVNGIQENDTETSS